MATKQTPSKNTIAVWIGILCIGTYIVNYYLRDILSVTTPELLLSGDFTEETIALLSSAYMFFYAGGQLLNGFLGDMISPKIMILSGILVGGGAMILFPFVENAFVRIACFAVLGFGLSMLRGPMMKVISENTEPHHARLICVFFSFSSFAGPLIASLFTLVFAARYAFVVAGGVAILMAIVSFSFMSVMQKKRLLTFRKFEAKKFSSILEVFRIENFVFYMVIACLVEISTASVSFWIPTYLTVHFGFDVGGANLVFSLISICRACMPFLALAIFNMTGERALPIIRTAFALSCLLFASLIFVSHPVANVMFLIFALMCMSCVSALLWSIFIPGLGKTGHASSANGVLDCSGYTAAALANLLFARIMSRVGWTTVLILWASIGIIGLLATLFAKEKRS